jgi:hypothetical protein
VTIAPGFISTVFRLSSNNSAKFSLIAYHLYETASPADPGNPIKSDLSRPNWVQRERQSCNTYHFKEFREI